LENYVNSRGTTTNELAKKLGVSKWKVETVIRQNYGGTRIFPRKDGEIFVPQSECNKIQHIIEEKKNMKARKTLIMLAPEAKTQLQKLSRRERKTSSDVVSELIVAAWEGQSRKAGTDTVRGWFPDCEELQPGDWSSYGQFLKITDSLIIEIGLYCEGDKSLTLHMFANDDVILCQTVELLDHDTQAPKRTEL
jgi:hypothetical protein